MVNTRHHQGPDDEPEGTFLSIEERKTMRTKATPKIVRNLYEMLNRNWCPFVLQGNEDSDDSAVVHFRRPKLEDSYLRKRTARATAKRVTYVEDYVNEDTDSDIDFPRKTRHGLRRGNLNVLIDDADKDEDDHAEGNKSARGRERLGDGSLETGPRSPGRPRSQVGCPRLPGRPRADGPPRSPGRPSKARKTADYIVAHPSPKQIKMERLADMDENGVRRSSRTRRIYRTYDQVLERNYEQMPFSKRQRREVAVERRGVEVEEPEGKEDDGFTDIYSRVKRQRKTVKRDMYGMPIETDTEEVDDHEEEGGEDDRSDEHEDGDDNEEDGDNDGEEEEEDDDDDDDNESEEKKTRRSYNLRENKPRTQHYIAPIQESRQRTRFFNDEVSTLHSPARRRRPKEMSYMSPARRRGRPESKRRRAFHGSSSTSSSSSDSGSSDEDRFQRRKAKSMLKARQRCLPMNFDPDDISRSTLLRDRQKIGSSLADVDPMNIDKSVTFNSVGGLGKHIRALKEMVVFPLMYPEVFERFKIAPPRGVLFYGPPGTGKTLVARALANECSTDGKRVAFYMRKGADCLSKWVGESERQLRLLFDQAYQTRPSIIFFDEIDGLAPVRSSRQDQIHSSIVSTLLALMDGLDSRGEIVVIGATNRLDSIDPALRRPGRFDREFLFPLPSVQARNEILKIHTTDWNPKLCDKFVSEVAERCIGYCGADMKALCTEVALLALRRRYPQIYTSSEKLQIDVTSINISAIDFHDALKSLVPASQRSVMSPARSLTTQIMPLLDKAFTEILDTLNLIFPSVLMQLSNLDTPAEKVGCPVDVPGDEVWSEDDDVNIYEHKVDRRKKLSNIPEPETFLNFTSYAHRHPTTHRPRLLLSGGSDQGQTSYLAPAVIHHLEQLPVHTLDLASLYAVNARTPEESCAHIFREARRTSPSIVYLPHVDQWWNVIGETVRSTVLTLIHDIDPSSPVLLLATSENEYSVLDYDLQDLFDEYCGEMVAMRNPTGDERHEFFKNLLLCQASKPPPQRKLAQRVLEELPKAAPPEPRKLTEHELKQVLEHEEATFTELRLFLRDTLNKLGRDRKFFIFTKPVDIEDVPDYYEIIKKPMDLSTMMSKIDLHHYQSVKEFLSDINQICLNALEYNPDKDHQSRVIRHRACALNDTASAIIKSELDKEFEQICESIVASRKQRGETGTKTAPSFYHTKPLNMGPMHPLAITKPTTSGENTPRDPNVRTSRRIQGADVPEIPSLEDVERTARHTKRLRLSPSKEKENNSTPQGQVKKNTPGSKTSSALKQSQGSSSGTKISSSSKSSSVKKPVRKDIWGSKGYKKRKKKRKRVESEVKDFTEIQNDEQDADDDVNDSNIDDDDEIQEGMATDEEEAIDGTMQCSPRRDGKQSPRRVSTEKSADGKSPRRDSMNELTVDVHMKSPKENARSPSQRSPRAEGQKSPQVVSRSQNESPSQSRSPKPDSGHMTSQHSSGGRSPIAQENQNSSLAEIEHKPPRNLTKSPERIKHNTHIRKRHIYDETSPHQTSPQKQVPSPSGTNIDKCVVLPGNGFVDSGIGSSDSNGDSNDSVGKLATSSDTNIQDAATSISQAVPEQQNDLTGQPDDASPEKEAASPALPVTRSRTQTRAQEKAVEVLSELQGSLEIDRERLVRLLDMTVLLTEDYTIPRLEKLYSLYAQCIYQHRLQYNKIVMTEEMEKRLTHYTASITQRLKAEKHRAITS